MSVILARAGRWAGVHAERLVYRVAGLPVAVRALFAREPQDNTTALRSAYAQHYWRPQTLSDLVELIVATLIWPVGLVGAAGWFVWKNGPIIRKRHGTSLTGQFFGELRAYFAAGILPPWYYQFELHDGRAESRAFLCRFEMKAGIYPILRRSRGGDSPLNDKVAFADLCRRHHVRAVPVIVTVSAGDLTWLDGESLPAADVFVKPVRGRGGKGAERWDYVGERRYRHASLGTLGEGEFLDRLRDRSRSHPLLVQPRVRNCAELDDLNNGALSTVRIVTCLNELGEPEVIAGVMRMATGDNHVVDNFHAGGIAAAVDFVSGELGSASDLGTDAALGWVESHPDTHAPIRGRIVPRWNEACALAQRAHRLFKERVAVGWDIAPAEAGPIIVEGNAAPDFDIIQRANRSGLADSRLSELLLYHVLVETGQVTGSY